MSSAGGDGYLLGTACLISQLHVQIKTCCCANSGPDRPRSLYNCSQDLDGSYAQCLPGLLHHQAAA